MVKLGNDWDEILASEFEKPYYQQLRGFLKQEYSTQVIHPGMHDIFNALRFTSFENTKVVILGQDPYHAPGQAHGLSFSVKKGVKQPPSLENIFKEIQSDLGIHPPSHGCLEDWANQGVLLLNAVLTVRSGAASSHAGNGCELFTNRVIEIINAKQQGVVFMLWGRHAIAKEELITNPSHLVLKAPHPSPLSAFRGFFGCKHFSAANRFLEDRGASVDWQIEE